MKRYFSKQDAQVSFKNNNVFSLEKLKQKIKLWGLTFGIRKQSLELLINFLSSIFTDDLINEINTNPKLNNIFQEIFIHKIDHSIAAIAYFQNSFKILKEETILSVFIMQIIQVDLADTIGEFKELRVFEKQNKFFECLLESSINKTSKTNTDKLRQILFEINLNDNNLIFNVINKFNSYLHKNFQFRNLKERNIQKIIKSWIKEYYSYIINDHINNIDDGNSNLLSLYYENFKNIKDWRDFSEDFENIDSRMKATFFGDSISFLTLIAFYIEYPKKRQPHFFTSLLNAFRYVGFYNVLLDDLSDYLIDKKNNDHNMYYENMNKSTRDYYSSFSDKISLAFKKESHKYFKIYKIHSVLIHNLSRIRLDMLSLYSIKTIKSNWHVLFNSHVLLWLLDLILKYKISCLYILKYIIKYTYFKFTIKSE